MTENRTIWYKVISTPMRNVHTVDCAAFINPAWKKQNESQLTTISCRAEIFLKREAVNNKYRNR